MNLVALQKFISISIFIGIALICTEVRAEFPRSYYRDEKVQDFNDSGYLAEKFIEIDDHFKPFAFTEMFLTRHTDSSTPERQAEFVQQNIILGQYFVNQSLRMKKEVFTYVLSESLTDGVERDHSALFAEAFRYLTEEANLKPSDVLCMALSSLVITGRGFGEYDEESIKSNKRGVEFFLNVLVTKPEFAESKCKMEFYSESETKFSIQKSPKDLIGKYFPQLWSDKFVSLVRLKTIIKQASVAMTSKCSSENLDKLLWQISRTFNRINGPLRHMAGYSENQCIPQILDQ